MRYSRILLNVLSVILAFSPLYLVAANISHNSNNSEEINPPLILDLSLLSNEAADPVSVIASFLPIYDKAFQALIRLFALDNRSADDLAEHFVNVFAHFPETKPEVDIIVNKHFNISSKKSNLKGAMKRAFLSMLDTYKVDIALQQADFKMLKNSIHNQEIEELKELTPHSLGGKTLEELVEMSTRCMFYLNAEKIIKGHLYSHNQAWKNIALTSNMQDFKEKSINKPLWSYADFTFLLFWVSVNAYILNKEIKSSPTLMSSTTMIISTLYVCFLSYKIGHHFFVALRENSDRARYLELFREELFNEAEKEGIDLLLINDIEDIMPDLYKALLASLKEKLISIIENDDLEGFIALEEGIKKLKAQTMSYHRKLVNHAVINKNEFDIITDLVLNKKSFYQRPCNVTLKAMNNFDSAQAPSEPESNQNKISVEDSRAVNSKLLYSHISSKGDLPILQKSQLLGNLCSFNFFVGMWGNKILDDRCENTILDLAYKHNSRKLINHIQKEYPWFKHYKSSTYNRSFYS